MNTVTTLLYTWQEVDFLLYQIGRYGVDVNDVCILALRRYGTDGNKPLISGPGARYFGLQGLRELFFCGLCIAAYGAPPTAACALSENAEKRDIADIFFSIGIPAADTRKYISGIRHGGMLVCIRVYNDAQKKYICDVLAAQNDDDMRIFNCPLQPANPLRSKIVKENV